MKYMKYIEDKIMFFSLKVCLVEIWGCNCVQPLSTLVETPSLLVHFADVINSS